MVERRRISVEAAEAVAEVLLADAMRERRERLATIAEIRRWLTPRWYWPQWYGPSVLRPGEAMFHARATLSGDAMHVAAAPSSTRSASLHDDSMHCASWTQGPGEGCFGNDWHQWDRWHDAAPNAHGLGNGDFPGIYSGVDTALCSSTSISGDQDCSTHW